MTDLEYRKALLLTKIEAHRQILRLEARCARATLNPWNAALTFLGVDATIAAAISSAVHAILGRHGDAAKIGGAIVPLIVAGVMPLLGGERKAPPEQAEATGAPSAG